MTDKLLNPNELRERGFKALVEALGWANAVRFMQQFSSSTYNYTDERQQILPDWGPEELVRRTKELKP